MADQTPTRTGENVASQTPEPESSIERPGVQARWRLRPGERKLLLVVGDIFAGTLGTILALWVWSRPDWLSLSIEFVRARAPWFVLMPVFWALLMINLYDLRKAASVRETIRGVLIAGLAGVVLYLGVYFSSSPGSLPRLGVAYFLAAATSITFGWRLLYIRVFTTPAFARRVLIVGAGDSGTGLAEVVQQFDHPPFTLVGLVDDDPKKLGQSVRGLPVLGNSSELVKLTEREQISDLIVAILGPMNGEMLQAILDVQEGGVEVARMSAVYEQLLERVPIRYLEADWVVRSFVDEVRVSGLYLLSKRLIDLVGTAIGLVTLGLLYPWISLAILLESGRPILHEQVRLGQGARRFKVVKFRTMQQDAESDGRAHWARDDDPRKTRVGHFLRKTHLDELPQFWNVLKGEMSLVGPRPERPEMVKELEKQIPFYRARLLVKPGIGGWAQVNYGKGASIAGSAEKLEYDLYYIKHRSLILDLWIILRSITAAMNLRGV